MRYYAVMKLYDYAASANCYKVRLLLAQLGREYERVEVDIFGGDTLTDDFAALNPLRSTPVLVLDDGRVLVESNAILWYLAHDTPFLPQDPLEQAEVVRWLIFEQSDVMYMIGGLRFRLVTGRWTADDEHAVARRDGAYETLQVLDEHLRSRAFLVAGRYTIADAAVYAYAHVAGEAGIETTGFPHFGEWLARVRKQRGFIDDLAPYPPNASVLAGRSIYG
jgi:glutathione S-transferase